MAKKVNEKHTALGLSVLRGINEARAYARGEADGVQAKTFRTRQMNVKKYGCVRIYSR